MRSGMLDALEQIEADRGISKEVLLGAVEAALLSAYKRHYGSSDNVTAKIVPATGDIKVFARKVVVDHVEDPNLEVQVGDPAVKKAKIGEVVEVEVTPKNFGRIAAQTAKQVVIQRIREAERDLIYNEFKGKEMELVNGKVQRAKGGNLFVEIGRSEALLPNREVPPKEHYREGDRVKALILSVKMSPKGPQVLLSRSHPAMVQKLFEMEVSEIYDKTVEIKAIAREASFRTKIAVYSNDPAVDPVGACVGQRGMRVQTVVRELGGEKIDIVQWDPEMTAFIKNSLSPAQVDRVELDSATGTALVVVPDDQLSLAIGKEGQNARLSAKLTGWRIDIKSQGELAKVAAEELLSAQFGAEGESAPAVENLEDVPGIGPKTAEQLRAAGYETVAALAAVTLDDLKAVDGIGPKTAEKILEGLKAVKAPEASASAKSDRPQPPVIAPQYVPPSEEPAPAEPFVFEDGRQAETLQELQEICDALSGDEISIYLQKNSFREWMEKSGYSQQAIADFHERYMI